MNTELFDFMCFKYISTQKLLKFCKVKILTVTFDFYL